MAFASRPPGPKGETAGGRCRPLVLNCAGEHVFEYSIIPHAGSWRETGILELAHQFSVPPLVSALARAASEITVPAHSCMWTGRDRAERSQEGGKGRQLHPEALECFRRTRCWPPSTSRCRSPRFTKTDLAERRRKAVPEDRNGTFAVEFPPWKNRNAGRGSLRNRRKGRVAPPDGPDNL